MRYLIKVYFDLLKKHRENELIPQLEAVKNDLEEQLINYQKQLLTVTVVIDKIDVFLSHPIPIPPFLTKELLFSFWDEIYIDLRLIKSKFISIKKKFSNLKFKLIQSKKTWLFFVFFILICIFLSYIVTNFIRKYFLLISVALIIIILIYVIIRLRRMRAFYVQKLPILHTLVQQTENEIESLERQIRDAKIYDISDLEVKVDEYLENDKLGLIDIAKHRLKIRQELIDQNPIISFIGVNSREASESNILITDRELEKIKTRYKDLLIDEHDFYEEKGTDGKYRYGIYECFIIFLCENFLSYYKCYWNFIKGDYVDEETCEYLFDSIVSVKTQERSSLNQQNPDEKRKYRNFLSITTMDSKIVYFKMSDDKKRKINYSNSLKYVSDIDKAAERIRYWLRQRRVDYQMTKDMDK